MSVGVQSVRQSNGGEGFSESVGLRGMWMVF